ncbi:hypothetical protein D9M73_273780 [compost metagenome]
MVIGCGVYLPWLCSARRVVCVIPLLVDRPVESVELRTGVHALDIEHPLFGLVTRIGAEQIFITTGGFKLGTGCHYFADDPAKRVVSVADLDVIVIAIE